MRRLYITFGRLYEGIFKIRYMEELIKLKTFCELEIEKANGKLYSNEPPIYLSTEIQLHERVEAFSEVIKQLDLILNNSVVKPSERRSPTDEAFDGVSRPNERQNPQEKKSESNENIDDRNKIPFYKLCPECSATF